jgi:CRISPR-associated protein Cmr6
VRDRLADLARGERPDHAGLAYEVWAPVDRSGKVDETQRDAWLSRFEKIPVPVGYGDAFQRWARSLAGADTRRVLVRATSRLLIGHGNPAPTDVGLTLHRTWGVPVIPGSSLKGLAASYVEAVYGPDAPNQDPTRTPFAGVGWEGKRIARGPGDAYRRLFGAPDADDRSPASRGEVVFHDALWVPAEGEALPLARDVLTVHQKGYYGSAGATWPNDYDGPNPVAFLTVVPGARFLVALSGPEELLDVALRCATEALDAWGIGGKTAAGYGRLVVDKGHGIAASALARQRSAKLDELQAWMERPEVQGLRLLDRIEAIERDWIEALVVLPAPDREEGRRLVRSFVSSDKRTKERLRQLLGRLSGSGE